MNSLGNPTTHLLPAPSEQPERIWGSRAGWLTGTDGTGGLLVDFPGNSTGPITARLATAIDAQALKTAITNHQKVILLFESGDPRLPFIMAFIQESSPSPLVDALLEEPPKAPPALRVETRVDGRQVVIEGKDEIVLQCGEASITLRRNGKIVIRGTQIESCARGRIRIKGGSVEIN
ncbi:DUF6484 domain-containing protein [Hyalangium rubrum]|uniref:DUF6484 domain-containing protein n=1 Tax=Hyalangium rubrum TaxID=3103134 RepID=A0ABU5HFT1_9BACT|nr:DUF6484 domain-containing protein [Hyalangium sp. s54d21]MDY7230920.1 DUF6484 domain-containing protein [Hyalangium sp. s54d21]